MGAGLCRLAEKRLTTWLHWLRNKIVLKHPLPSALVSLVKGNLEEMETFLKIHTNKLPLTHAVIFLRTTWAVSLVLIKTLEPHENIWGKD